MEHRKPPVSPEVALASEVFDQFCSATTLKTILGHHRHLCELLHIKPNVFPLFYPKLKAKLRTWKAQALWNKFDKRASHKCYNRGKACPNTRVLIIGAGPCGLRSAIEAQLLGCKVVVVEKRDRITRNNVLHLWPFVIQDLRALGAKKFFGKFCAGAIDHISIRQLQCILLKVALILGVEFHEGVGFEALVPPPENQSVERIGWRFVTSPPDHPVSQYEFDVLIGADGKRNTLEGFKRKEFRGKLAIAITANFINRRTEAEARVEEISGVAFIFNQKFFKDLYAATGIDLENIVYYKDETHYFVMTAKKHSLLNKNVIIKDLPDTAKLLDRENVNKEALEEYAREAADFSTNYKLPHTEFAVNHYGQPDVAMFDFTSMYAAENASRVVERNNHKLLTLLVGDSLLEPFWPTGSGCARGFLSVLDACHAVRSWGMGANPLEVLAERESIYRLLGQTTPENLNRDLNAYTLEPHTRYPNLNPRCVAPIQVRGLYDSDNPESLEALLAMPSASALDPPKKRRRKDSQVHSDTLLFWLKKQVALYDNVQVDDMTTSFKNGLVLCAIIHRYRPDLIDFHALQPENIVANNQLAFDILERELGVPPVMTAQEMEQCEVPDKLTMLSYLSQIYDTFRGEIPHIKHPRLDEAELAKEKRAEQILATRMREIDKLTTGQKVNLLGRLTSLHTGRASSGRKREADSDRHETAGASTHSDRLVRRSVESARKSRKRRSNLPERMGHTLEERMIRLERLEEIKRNREERERRGRYLRELTTQQFHKSMQMLQANALLRPESAEGPFEDYSIFLYRMTAPDFQDRVKHLEQKLLYPSRDSKTLEEMKRGSMDPEFSGRVKNIEEKLKGIPVTEKKPKDLLRAIGKIEKTDWNVQEIEKKIEENKCTSRLSKHKAEKVPKWSKEKFQDKKSALEHKFKMKGTDEDPENKYQEIDISLKNFERKRKEGNALEAGKVSAMAAQLASMNQETDKPSVQRSNSRAALVLPAQGGSEVCHFCNKRVYLMERLTAEGRFFHRGCFRCDYCKTTLRLGNYAFDRDGKYGSRFFCTHHFGFHGTQKMKTPNKLANLANKGKENIPRRSAGRSAEKVKVDNTVDGVEAKVHKTPVQATAAQELDKDRGHTPERITFDPVGSSDPDDNPSEMDEDEWTDRNFGASAAECGSSDDLSDLSDESDGEEAEGFAEAIDAPMTADETLRLAERWSRRFSSVGSHQNGSNPDDENQQKRGAEDEDDLESGSYDYEDSEDDFSYHEYDSEDDESDTATEGEEDIRARELRKQEVRLVLPERPPGRRGSDTGSDTEVKTAPLSCSSDMFCSASDFPAFDSDNKAASADQDDNSTSISVSDLSTAQTASSPSALSPVPSPTYHSISPNNTESGKLSARSLTPSPKPRRKKERHSLSPSPKPEKTEPETIPKKEVKPFVVMRCQGPFPELGRLVQKKVPEVQLDVPPPPSPIRTPSPLSVSRSESRCSFSPASPTEDLLPATFDCLFDELCGDIESDQMSMTNVSVDSDTIRQHAWHDTDSVINMQCLALRSKKPSSPVTVRPRPPSSLSLENGSRLSASPVSLSPSSVNNSFPGLLTPKKVSVKIGDTQPIMVAKMSPLSDAPPLTPPVQSVIEPGDKEVPAPLRNGHAYPKEIDSSSVQKIPEAPPLPAPIPFPRKKKQLNLRYKPLAENIEDVVLRPTWNKLTKTASTLFDRESPSRTRDSPVICQITSSVLPSTDTGKIVSVGKNESPTSCKSTVIEPLSDQSPVLEYGSVKSPGVESVSDKSTAIESLSNISPMLDSHSSLNRVPSKEDVANGSESEAGLVESVANKSPAVEAIVDSRLESSAVHVSPGERQTALDESQLTPVETQPLETRSPPSTPHSSRPMSPSPTVRASRPTPPRPLSRPMSPISTRSSFSYRSMSPLVNRRRSSGGSISSTHRNSITSSSYLPSSSGVYSSSPGSYSSSSRSRYLPPSSSSAALSTSTRYSTPPSHSSYTSTSPSYSSSSTYSPYSSYSTTSPYTPSSSYSSYSSPSYNKTYSSPSSHYSSSSHSKKSRDNCVIS